MVKIFHDADADLSVLGGKKIAVIGYGSQGRAQSLCLRDSGCDVVVGLRRNGASWKRAEEEGVPVSEIPEAVQDADVVMMLLPDEVQGGVYEEQIKPYLKTGCALDFAHGFSILYKQVVPPEEVDVIMMAPKAPGNREREVFVEGFGVPALIAVEKDYSGNAKEIALAIAKGIGATKAGVLETTFQEETTSDLFGEQSVLCGGVTGLIIAGFETLVENGYQPEIAYFEVFHELKLIVDLIQSGGLMGMWNDVSNTAEFGGLSQRNKVITSEAKKGMQQILDNILSGEFSEEWIADWKTGIKRMRELEKEEKERQVEVVGREVRRLFEIGDSGK
jgi:ketol-acid reductoisomerase